MGYVFDKRGKGAKNPVPLVPVRTGEFKGMMEKAGARQQRWLEASGFEGKKGQVGLLPGADGGLSACWFGMQGEGWLYQLAHVHGKLPPGTYTLQCDWSAGQRTQASLGWGLESYRFDRYRKRDDRDVRLFVDKDVADDVRALHGAQALVRDLVNTPTEHLGPAELADAVFAEADHHGAECRVIAGDDLLSDDFPAIHAVGRASSRPPRLIEMDWREENDLPLVVLVGKGVCFDTGGLDLKDSSGMALMKKDMGGAAHALGLARLVMEHGLPVRLKLLIPAVENAVAGNAYRPGDVIRTRKGLTIEIGNTDAEGRVILADALAYGCESKPDLVVDFATLTGAARVALGPDLPALFSNGDAVARAIQEAGEACEDPLWTLPLHRPYKELFKSQIADINNSGKSSFAGAITAALFLEHFVTAKTDWVHIDTFAWNPSGRPGRPEGGEALGMRAVFRYLQSRYGGTGSEQPATEAGS